LIRIFRTISRRIPTSSASGEPLLFQTRKTEQREEISMQTDIQARSFPLTDALRNHVHNRLGFTFLYASSRVRRVLVRLSDLNGPRGGIDKRCLVEVRLEGLPVVVVEDVQSDMYSAIDRAVGRAARTVKRRLALRGSRRYQTAPHAHLLATGQ
jgi:putative sigma-54 modulation protein